LDRDRATTGKLDHETLAVHRAGGISIPLVDFLMQVWLAR